MQLNDLAVQPRLVQADVTVGRPDAGTVVLFTHRARLVPSQARVSVEVPVITAAGPLRQEIVFGPSSFQPVLSERMYSSWLDPVATNSGCAGVVPLRLGRAATAGAAMIFPPSECQPAPSCGACAQSAPFVPSAPIAIAGAGAAVVLSSAVAVPQAVSAVAYSPVSHIAPARDGSGAAAE